MARRYQRFVPKPSEARSDAVPSLPHPDPPSGAVALVKIQEADAKTLLVAQGLPVPDWEVAHTVPEARAAAERILAAGASAVVIKAQVLVGGRGKAGGVKLASSADEAETVAANIHAEMRGGNRTAFAFEGLGKLGALGHNCAIADVFGVKVSGFPAWLLWRTIYLMKLPGINTKIRVAADWLIALLLPPDLAQLSLARMSGFHEQHFTPGETVFHQGDLGDFVYVIQEGECDVLRTIDGQEQKLAELKAGDYFGEMAVLSDASRNATVRARTAMNVLLIPKNDFDKLKSNVPAFGEVFSALARKRGGE
jgi:hypothetical protein